MPVRKYCRVKMSELSQNLTHICTAEETNCTAAVGLLVEHAIYLCLPRLRYHEQETKRRKKRKTRKKRKLKSSLYDAYKNATCLGQNVEIPVNERDNNSCTCPGQSERQKEEGFKTRSPAWQRKA